MSLEQIIGKACRYCYVPVANGAGPALAVWLGRTVSKLEFGMKLGVPGLGIQMNPLAGFAFGAIVGVVASFAAPLLTQIGIKHEATNLALSYFIGGIAAYGLSCAAAAAGMIAAPMTIPTAVLITISALASYYLFHLLSKSLCPPSPEPVPA
jgi:hypothetical protein